MSIEHVMQQLGPEYTIDRTGGWDVIARKTTCEPGGQLLFWMFHPTPDREGELPHNFRSTPVIVQLYVGEFGTDEPPVEFQFPNVQTAADWIDIACTTFIHRE